MSVQTKLDTILSNCDDIREALVEKGVSSASTHGTSGFADDIRSIPSGGNGLVATYHIDENGVAQAGPFGDLVFNGVVDIAENTFSDDSSSIFKTKTNITSVSFPDLKTISGNGACYAMFSESPNLSSIDFPQLSSITGSYATCYVMFYNCNSLETVSMPSLKEVTIFQGMGQMFGGCTSLKSARFENLTSVYGDEMFKGCTALSSVYLPELSSVNNSYGMFDGCTALSSISLPKLKHADEYGGMWNFFHNCTSLAEVHFGAANKEAIEALDIYDDKFGAPSTCVFYFDL